MNKLYLKLHQKYFVVPIFLIFHFILLYFSKWIISLFLKIEEFFPINFDENDLVEDFFFFLIFFGLITPIIEEVSFRLWINKGFKYLFISICTLLLYSFLTSNSYFVIILTVGLFIAHTIIWKKTSQNRLLFRFIFLFHALLFAGIHLENFDLNDLLKYYYYVPALIIPQFILGMILLYIRVDFGFKYSTAYHILYNSILIFQEFIVLTYE